MSDVTDVNTQEFVELSDGVTKTGIDASPVEPAESTDAGNSVENTLSGSLEDEGDIAADYIEELLDICDLDGDIDIDARGGRAYVSVNSSEDSNLRLLSNPDTVQALQELTRLAVQTKTGGFSRLILDVGGSRQIREAELARLVTTAIDRIEVGGERMVALEAMSSYERKVVHDLVAERGFASASEGEGRDRHTVISAA
ncbi:DNA-binding protein [Subtercola sp. PAMC28395]|uniref:Jag family protein n=1 Tax=Subtercola sp. PAMC28395 TaxID=2846775 RepID=UPI001C0B8C16|nr:R3H domain-containing nucleic acid-binding protein [Subtercola sp. PAMC28395]QWT24661.1 DNA-binding protein [Subtercola sp. PAMC28395]